MSVSPVDAAPGSYVTLFGNNLGSSVGTMVFLGNEDDPTDDVAAALACSTGWSSDQVIVAVPTTTAPLAPRPLPVTTANALSDRTDDTNGRALPDFTVNDTARPGLCQVLPSAAGIGVTVRVTGSNLGTDANGQVYLTPPMLR